LRETKRFALLATWLARHALLRLRRALFESKLVREARRGAVHEGEDGAPC
jgi:hypothetical protein